MGIVGVIKDLRDHRNMHVKDLHHIEGGSGNITRKDVHYFIGMSLEKRFEFGGEALLNPAVAEALSSLHLRLSLRCIAK